MNALLNSLPANLAGIPGRLAAMVLLAAALTASPAQSQSTSAMSVAPPRSAARPVFVTFSNQTKGTVVANWVDTRGAEQQVGVMLPNQAMELTTHPGHVTIFYSGGQQIGVFRATSSDSGSILGIAGPNGVTNNPVPTPPIICVAMPGGGGGSGNPGQVTLSGIGGLIQSILNGTLTGLPGGGTNPGITPAVTPANQPDFAARLVGTKWTYVYGNNTFEFEFGPGQVKDYTNGWWPGVVWKTNGKSKVQFKNDPKAVDAKLPPGPSAVGKVMDITFDSATTFKGIDFDGVTPISGQRK